MDWVTPVRSARFVGEQSFTSLLDICKQDAAHTKLLRLQSAEAALLDVKTGRTVSADLRFNRDAFAQLCSLIGLPISVIEGAWDGSNVGESAKREWLLRAVNNFVKISSAGLLKQNYVIDSRLREIVGLVGGRYHLVTNAELMGQVAVWLRDTSECKYQSVSGAIRNRDIALLLSRVGHVVTFAQVKWTTGVAVHNSETTRRAIYLPQIVFDSETRSYSMQSESPNNRMIHRKQRQFDEKLDSMVRRSMSRELLATDLVDGITNSRKWISEKLPTDRLAARASDSLIRLGVGALMAKRVGGLLLAHKERVTRWDYYRVLLKVADESLAYGRLLRVKAFNFLFGEIK